MGDLIDFYTRKKIRTARFECRECGWIGTMSMLEERGTDFEGVAHDCYCPSCTSRLGYRQFELFYPNGEMVIIHQT